MVMLSKGYEKYNAKLENINGIFNKLNGIINVDKYKKQLDHIKEEVDSLDFEKRTMPSSSMQTDYEHYSLTPYGEKIDDLISELESEILPFYEVHLWTNKINEDIKNINEENAEQIIDSTKNLIRKINSIYTHNNEDLTKIIDNAYKCIYNVILNEEMLDKHDILTFINNIGNEANREALGKLIRKDIKAIPKSTIVSDELKNIRKEGLGYDFLTNSVVREIALIELSEKSDNFKRRKIRATETLSDQINSVQRRKKELDAYSKENTSDIKNLKINKRMVNSKLLSFVLVPVITFTIGHVSGKLLSNTIDEYKTITRTINYETNEMIGDSQEVYDEKGNTYTATIKVHSPWKRNPNGAGYNRTVKAYEYTRDENNPELDVEKIQELNKEKYKYVEHKETLSEDENTTDTVIYVIETYQDKSDTRKSTKYVLPFSLVGTGLGIGVEVLLAVFGVLNPSELNYEKNRLAKKIKALLKDKDNIEHGYKNLYRDVENLKEEYDSVTSKYGKVDELVLPQIEVETPKVLRR